MKSITKVQTLSARLPRFHKEVKQMALELGELSVENLVKELRCNDKITLGNKLRYQNFFNENAYLAALLAYYGQAYKHLKTGEYNLSNLLCVDKHLWITSFFYGLLQPLDPIHPYRLGGKTKLPLAEEKNILDYWRPLLTDMLIKTLKTDDGILVYLTVEGFEHLFDWGRLRKEARVIHPFFMVDQGSRLKATNIYAKSCCGTMTSRTICNQLTSYGDLLGFELDGLTHQPGHEDEEYPHFMLRT